jgi:hypothetical protein
MLFGWKPSVQAMRASALIGLGLTLGPFLSIGLHIYNKAQKSQQALIQLKYGALLMDVHERVVEPLSPAIDVRRIDDLARIAERQNTMILHMVFNYMDYYLVQGNGMTYRYVVGNTSRRDNVVVEEPTHRDIRDYILSNNAKRFVDADPSREVIVMDSDFTNGNQTQIAQPDEKVVMRYSINISRSHTKS